MNVTTYKQFLLNEIFIYLNFLDCKFTLLLKMFDEFVILLDILFSNYLLPY